MGDDLGDEWWTQGDNSDVEEEAQPTEEQSDVQTTKKRKIKTKQPDKVKKKKTLQEECITTEDQTEKQNSKDSVTSKTRKKRKKRKKITDVLASTEAQPGSPDDLRKLLNNHHSTTRSVIEQDELTLHDSCFLTCNDLTHSLSSYLKEVCPKWAKVQKQHTETRSLLLLIICGSALRTIELIKQLTTFKGDAKVLKLFAKHIKVEEQMKLLSKGVAHIGVGTPGRITALLEKEGMTLQGLRLLVLDWNYRDQKHRRMIDIPEVKADLLRLLDSGIIKSCREGAFKLGLF
ncbi:protein CMSS1 [Chanos chanos]|uniref:Protein CMSS1 n=1 Tax=Chanos chanos TaxID=29144 RepID=A0A6J2WDI5_CHACN|nr:protein CMSS1 [Chanos chanos]